MKKFLIWQLIYDSMEDEIPVMLLYVLDSTGSSPGRQGFFMAVNANGEMEGSIGGGIMEHKFVEMAKEKLKVSAEEAARLHSSGLRAVYIRKQVHDKSAAKNQSGMICSGEQNILLYELKEEDKQTVEQIIHSLEQSNNGTLRLSPAGIQFSEKIPANDYRFEMRSEEDWVYEEKTGYKNQLFIIGGGHCALAFSKIMQPMDFYIRLYEDRPELSTLLQNDYVHEKKIVKDYTALSELIPSGPYNYVVIMTMGYRTDDMAVRALVGKDFAYLGLLGSKTKTEQMFEQYRNEGIDANWLQRIHAPIGLSIKSQTPEEIAVSIAAEIVEAKNKNL